MKIFLEHFSVRLPKERARRQYGDRCGRSRSPSRSDGGDPAASSYGEREATQGKPLKNALGVLRGFIVASAHSALNPASSSAFLTALKSFGAQLTSKLPSECVKTSSAPALSAASIKASSGVLGANRN